LWEGVCGEVPVQFFTSKASLVTETPLQHFLLGGTDEEMLLTGFATRLEDTSEAKLSLLPLFFGRPIA